MTDTPSTDDLVPTEPEITEPEITEPEIAEPAPGEPPRRREPRFQLADWLRRVIISLLIIGALAGIFYTGMYATTGTDTTSQGLPDSVDRLMPASGDEVLVQAQVGVDLADGYTGYLTINGVDIRTPEDGLITNLGTGQVLYQPGAGKPVETLNSGQNCVIAMVWDQLETVETAKPVSWCFEAT